ncbi:type II secretion system protein N [Pseudoduganella armeniaca]|uniref:Type II secretion system protein N n=1 Tax=Pseudoduganella armeniaca TaxID=2072590 RepID=A0A2R4CHE4_9BURK|nr:type II secretion system protein N [Pseudoduganella armeniaca]AVR98878.1 general secretion pathway protein GspN [Pseudoduganella armeniaca]
MKRAILWLLAIVVTAALTLLVFFPAAWVAVLVERQTDGRLTLGDAQGTLWHGSAFVGGAASSSAAVTPLLPGRFTWQLSPLSLLGSVRMELSNPEALTQPVLFTGSWRQWQLSPAVLRLPADGLSGLGAPLNTLALSGRLQLAWTSLQLALVQRNVAVEGRTTLQMQDVSSRLTSIRPLGSYQLALDWHGQQAGVDLSTTKGPLLLSGTGQLHNGRLQFSGQAEAAKGYEETLGNLLNLLGQRRMVGGKNIIALEFR